jgi:hypothetical protein
MFLNTLALLTALSISGVAAYYSIYGLTAIFSGVFWPIVIMGSVLEVGKIITTVWLHTNWRDLKWFIKIYMSVAVVMLMFITSMGIFGFLSRAHIEVTNQAGNAALLIQQVDQGIATEKKRIADNEKVLAQLDDAVANLLSNSATNATKDNNRTATVTAQATKLRESQKKERAGLTQAIDDSNARIAKLNADKLKLEQEDLKIQAEVGPIKYIAQMIYDDNVDKNLLERAVRWVIVVIVAVFDPLAVCMVLGVAVVMTKRRERREARLAHEEYLATPQIIEVPVEVERIVEVEKIVEVEVPVEVEKLVEVPVDRLVEVEKIVEIEVPVEVEVVREVPVDRVVERIVEVEKLVPSEELHQEFIDGYNQALNSLDAAKDELAREREERARADIKSDLERTELQDKLAAYEKASEDAFVLKVQIELQQQQIEEFKQTIEDYKQNSSEDTAKMLELGDELAKLLAELAEKDRIIAELGQMVVAATPREDEPAGQPLMEFEGNKNSLVDNHSSFGPEFPSNPMLNQTFLRTDMMPSTMFKWNGLKWIEVRKDLNTSYTNDPAILSELSRKLRQGEIAWEDLTEHERESIEEWDRQNNPSA